ncbi:hypothetical protein Bca4012_041907 [Brassica carinata]
MRHSRRRKAATEERRRMKAAGDKDNYGNTEDTELKNWDVIKFVKTDPETEAIRHSRKQDLMARHGTIFLITFTYGNHDNHHSPEQEGTPEDAKRKAYKH